MPMEPMYLILNVDSSTRWGWPSHVGCADGAEYDTDGCKCCYDCKSLECTRCMLPDYGSGGSTTTNSRAWLADMCDMLPADYLIDHVRVYQRQGAIKTSCNPASHPTREWILGHESNYVTPDMEEALGAVAPGGGACTSDADCTAPHGSCVDNECECAAQAAVQMTGPHCRSQAAGASLTCWSYETAARSAGRTTASAAGMFAFGLESCAAPRSYNVTWLRAMRTMLCESPGVGALGLVACDTTAWNGTRGDCSHYARATEVLQAIFEDSGQTTCCDGLARSSDGQMRLFCRRGPAVASWLAAIAVLAVGFSIITMCRGQCFWVGMFRRKPKPTASAAMPPDAHVVNMMGTAETVDAPLGADADTSLGASLLDFLSAKQRATRRALLKSLTDRCAFQTDNCDNQAEHLESLLLSHLSTCEGDFIEAVDAMHSELLGAFERWSTHMAGRGYKAGSSRGGASGGGGDDAHRLLAPDTQQQLADVALYLLVWGEAANLRFMPELLFFVFALAKAHCADKEPLEPAGAPASAEAAPTFLGAVVQPVYDCVFRETFTGLKKGRPVVRSAKEGLSEFPRNYDDWNQQFWSASAIRRLCTSEGLTVMGAPPGTARWQRLLKADWYVHGRVKHIASVRVPSATARQPASLTTLMN